MNSIFLQTHCQKDKLTFDNPEYEKWVFQYTFVELEKDLGASGDVTTNTLFSMDKEVSGFMLAKQSGILAGMQEFEWFLTRDIKKYGTPFQPVKMEIYKKDGEKLFASSKTPEKIAKLSGTVFDLMKIERVVLNLLGRMSGVSTFTAEFVKKARAINPDILVTPTRKTLWGLLDKRACILGGGGTHRLSLSDAILIKHNHICAFGSDLQLPLRKALNATFEIDKNGPKFVEVEVNNPRDAEEAIRILSDIKKKEYPLPCFIMFDNILPKDIAGVFEKIKKGLSSGELAEGIFFEASGGITLENIQDYAKTGVDIISIGAITHSAEMLDFTFRVL